MATVTGEFKDAASAVSGRMIVSDRFKTNPKVKVLLVDQDIYLPVQCPADHVDLVSKVFAEAGAIDVK